MTSPFRTCLLASCLAALALPAATAQEILAEDYGSEGAYGKGWTSGTNGGRGFGPWSFRQAGNVREYSHSGFGTRGQHPTLGDRVLTMWANGEYYEVAAAFRSFNKPLATGETFSLVMDNGLFEKRFDSDDPKPGVIGFSLRSSNSAETWDETNLDARLIFGFFEGEPNYRLIDGSEDADTGVPLSTTGVYVGVKLTSPDTYDIEIKTLGENQVSTVLTNRTLGGDPGTPITSFAVFSQDGEKNDPCFNSFRVFR
jgi:hypothetical protein